MAEELDKKKVTALSELTTPSDNDIYITGEGGQAPLRKISFGTIAEAIKTKLATWTFDALSTAAKTLTGAINELNASLPFRGVSNTLTSQYPTLYSYITAVGKTRDIYLYDWWNNNMFSDMPTRKSATNCAVTIDYHNGASDKVYGTVLVTYTWTDGSYQQFLGKIAQSSSTSITWIELPNRSEINALNSKTVSSTYFNSGNPLTISAASNSVFILYGFVQGVASGGLFVITVINSEVRIFDIGTNTQITSILSGSYSNNVLTLQTTNAAASRVVLSRA